MHPKQAVNQEEVPEDDDSIYISDEELEAYICRLEQELGMSRAEFIQRVEAGTEPDTFAAMALKDFLFY